MGAQAVYLRVGEADLAVAPYTTDGDLAIDPEVLAEVPPLEEALAAGGFKRKSADSVGLWITHRVTATNPATEVAVDLLVPAAVSPGRGRRAANLRGHDRTAARIVRGLEGAIVDLDTLSLAALATNDPRAFPLRVAGPAALLVAKLHKIHERTGSPRGSDKDALDVLRLLRGTSTEDLAARYARLREDSRSSAVADEALNLPATLFGDFRGVGVEMILRATTALADPEELTASCVALTSDLLEMVQA